MAFAVKASSSHSSHSVLCRRCAIFVVDLHFVLQVQFLRNKCVYTSLFPSARQLSRVLDHITKSSPTSPCSLIAPFHKSFELPTTSLLVGLALRLFSSDVYEVQFVLSST